MEKPKKSMVDLKLKKKLKRKRERKAFEKMMKQNLKLETELSRAALFEAGINFQMYDVALKLEAKRKQRDFIV